LARRENAANTSSSSASLAEHAEDASVRKEVRAVRDPSAPVSNVDVRDVLTRMTQFFGDDEPYQSALRSMIELLRPGEAVLEVQSLGEREHLMPWDLMMTADQKRQMKQLLVASTAADVSAEQATLFRDWLLAPKPDRNLWRHVRGGETEQVSLAQLNQEASQELVERMVDANEIGLEPELWPHVVSAIPLSERQWAYTPKPNRVGRRTLEQLHHFVHYPPQVRRWLEDIKWPRGTFTQTGLFMPLMDGRGISVPDLHPVQRTLVREFSMGNKDVMSVGKGNVADIQLERDLVGCYRFGLSADELAPYPEKLKELFSFKYAPES
jgi:hypothetical protein